MAVLLLFVCCRERLPSIPPQQRNPDSARLAAPCAPPREWQQMLRYEAGQGARDCGCVTHPAFRSDRDDFAERCAASQLAARKPFFIIYLTGAGCDRMCTVAVARTGTREGRVTFYEFYDDGSAPRAIACRVPEMEYGRIVCREPKYRE